MPLILKKAHIGWDTCQCITIGTQINHIVNEPYDNDTHGKEVKE